MTRQSFAEMFPGHTNEDGLTKLTMRGAGKTHRATGWPDGWVSMSCSCPGSRNGRLVKQCTIIAGGWEKANCGN